MLLIECPNCGPRDESEFTYGGESHVIRPPVPNAMTDGEWADYLYYRKNPLGRHMEQWNHSAGCRRWFNAVRHTGTYSFEAIYGMGERPPEDSS